MAAVVTALAKVAIPLGLGLVLLASRKGQSNVKAISLTRRAVRAMQDASGTDLEAVIEDFNSEDDTTTGGALKAQMGRMVSRGTRGFVDQPLYEKDSILKVNNKEWAVRLLQLEGRSKALDAWSEAYASIGAKNLAKDLKDKANALRPKGDKDKSKAKDKSKDKTEAKDDKGSSSKEDSSSDKLDAIAERVAAALATGDPAVMRKLAADLRKEGYPSQADSLEAAANEIEAERQKGKPVPVPDPTPVKPKRTVVVKSGDSEARITMRLINSDTRWNELVNANIPYDADGRKRVKLTHDNANGESLNRLGGLKPGLQPGQKLFIPDTWVFVDNTKDKVEVQKPKPQPDKPVVIDRETAPINPDDSLTVQLITMLVGKSPGQEDSFMVKKWQTANGRPIDGKYGTGDAIAMADKYDTVPPTPLYWSKKDTLGDLKKWKAEMGRLALEHPEQADAFNFAANAGKQPGFFGVPTSSKVISRRMGDGLGAP